MFFDASRRVLHEWSKNFLKMFAWTQGPPIFASLPLGTLRGTMDKCGVTSKVDWKYPISSFSAWSRRAISKKYGVHNMEIKIKKNNISVFGHFCPKTTKMAKNDKKSPKVENLPCIPPASWGGGQNATPGLISSFLERSRGALSAQKYEGTCLKKNRQVLGPTS